VQRRLILGLLPGLPQLAADLSGRHQQFASILQAFGKTNLFWVGCRGAIWHIA
jgi:hypothetical protein